jgi:hypothetical protein
MSSILDIMFYKVLNRLHKNILNFYSNPKNKKFLNFAIIPQWTNK